MSTDMLDAPREGESFREEGSFNVKNIQDGKEAALRKKVAEAQQVAAVEKVRMLQVKDKYEMLVGRKELAARYHKYLNKQLKERRILYVMINVDGTKAPNSSATGEGATAMDGETKAVPTVDDEDAESAQRIRVKIKAGQSAEYLAGQLVKKYALDPRHKRTIVQTLRGAIEKHEADTAVYAAEAQNVGMLMTPGSGGVDSDDEDAERGVDAGVVVEDNYLLMKKRLVRARRLAQDYAEKRGRIVGDLAEFAAAPKDDFGGGEPSAALVTELLFERDRAQSVKHQMVSSRDRVEAARQERRSLETYRAQLLQKLRDAQKLGKHSANDDAAGFWKEADALDAEDSAAQDAARRREEAEAAALAAEQSDEEMAFRRASRSGLAAQFHSDLGAGDEGEDSDEDPDSAYRAALRAQERAEAAAISRKEAAATEASQLLASFAATAKANLKASKKHRSRASSSPSSLSQTSGGGPTSCSVDSSAHATSASSSNSSGDTPAPLEGAEAAAENIASFFRDRLGSLSMNAPDNDDDESPAGAARAAAEDALVSLGLSEKKREPTPVLGPARGPRTSAVAGLASETTPTGFVGSSGLAGLPLGGLSGAWAEARGGWADSVAEGQDVAESWAELEAEEESAEVQVLPQPVQLAAWLPGLPVPYAYGQGNENA